jgi:hypothetical protein
MHHLIDPKVDGVSRMVKQAITTLKVFSEKEQVGAIA